MEQKSELILISILTGGIKDAMRKKIQRTKYSPWKLKMFIKSSIKQMEDKVEESSRKQNKMTKYRIKISGRIIEI